MDAETITASTHKNIFGVEFWFQTHAEVLTGLNIYFRTCPSMPQVKIVFPVFFSLWFATKLCYTAEATAWCAGSGVVIVFRTSHDSDILNIRVSN
jgi:hypothetical protein